VEVILAVEDFGAFRVNLAARTQEAEVKLAGLDKIAEVVYVLVPEVEVLDSGAGLGPELDGLVELKGEGINLDSQLG
jgi:hypothetical protein